MRFASNDKPWLITTFLRPENRNDITLVFDLENMNGMRFEFAKFLGLTICRSKVALLKFSQPLKMKSMFFLSSSVSNVSNSRQAGSDKINIYLINTSVYSV